MKIVCDACQAKYSISDDKVQGKVFKIRCKKCSNIIVVRGGAQASEPAPAQEKDTRVYDYGYDAAGGAAPADDAVWHLVINQDQVGPMTAAEVQQRFAAGEVDGDTFAWREGFADWLPLAQVDVFAGLIASGSTTTAAPPGGGAAAVAAMFGGADDGGTMRSDAGDLFASASASSSVASHADDDGGDLFGSKPAKSGGGMAASAAQQKLRGERNENSVLFSLNNLAQLASNSPAPAAAAAAPGHATGAAGGEGSGLIDIRSMASAYLGNTGAAVGGAKPASPGVGSMDDLPVFGGGGFSEPAVIVPTARAAANNKVLYIMIGAVGLLAIAAVIMVVMLLHSNKGNGPAAQVASADKSPGGDKVSADSDKPGDKAVEGAAGSAAAAATPADDQKPAEAASGSAAAEPATPPAAPAAPAPEEHTASHAAAPAHHETHHEAAHHEVAASHATHEAEPKPDTSGGGGGCDEVSCVLNNYAGACCQKFRKGGGHAASSGGSSGNSNLPDELTRDMISSAIASVKGRANSCGGRFSAKGLVKVHVRVGGDGRISSVSVSQSPDPGLGQCVASAVQHASFPKTQRGGSFAYPFIF